MTIFSLALSLMRMLNEPPRSKLREYPALASFFVMLQAAKY